MGEKQLKKLRMTVTKEQPEEWGVEGRLREDKM